MARHATRKEKALAEKLRREVENRKQLVYGGGHAACKSELSKAYLDAMAEGLGAVVADENGIRAIKLRREIDSRPCPECGTPADEIPLDRCATHDRQTALLDGLRNVNRTVTRALDEAGVPDHLQGAGEEDWDSNDPEEWGY